MTWLAGKQCVGCEACRNICPANCIDIVEQTGYLEAKKKDDLCIGCNKCKAVCPILKEKFPKAYASYALDEEIINSSSSGGIAPLLAECVISQGGVVFGAAFDSDFSVRHMAIEEKEGLDKIRRSKYVQSRIGNSYQQAAEYLLHDRTVLFTGTGCQIAGLLNYLQEKGIRIDNLFTQDIICHGVVLPKVWSKYLKEKEAEYQSKIVDISFRDKKNGWFNFGMKICFENGQIYHVDNKDDIYMQAFLSNICLNDSCYNCSFRGEKRLSDITLADFWSVYRVSPECFNEKGTSIVMVNSSKGEKMLDAIRNRMFMKEVKVHDITRSEIMLVTTVKSHVHRHKFLDMLDKKSLEKVFAETSCVRFGVMGSFNSRCIAKRCGTVLYQISNTNLVSLFSKPVINDSLRVKDNAFRDEMLRLDFKKTFIAELERYLEKIDYFIIDFLEERFGVIRIGDSFVADSDALRDADAKLRGCGKLLVQDDAYFERWKECCIRFVKLLSDKLQGKSLFLVKMYLAEMDSKGEYFGEVQEIRRINSVLEKMYLFFQRQCEQIDLQCNIVEIAKPLFYTNRSHVYGCYPEHFNMRAELMGTAVVNDLIGKRRN